MLAAVPTVGWASPRLVAPIEYRLEVGLGAGADAGVVTVTSLARLGLYGVDAVLARGERELGDGAAVPLRAATLLLVDAAIVSTATALPHEVLGHGARARELGLGARYDFSMPLPYALLTRQGFLNQTFWGGEDLPPASDDQARFVLGGYDAEELQLAEVAWSAFRAGVLARGDALLYAFGRPLPIRFVAGDGDPALHRRHLVERYGADPDTEAALTALSLASTALDPLVWASLATLARYHAGGPRTVPFPAVRAGPIDLSLTNRLWLVPWGREHRLGILAGAPVANAELAARFGEGPGGSSFGLALRVSDVALEPWLVLSTTVETFHQPALLVASERTGTGFLGAPPERLLGLAASLGADLHADSLLAGLRIAAKTPGHLPGRPYAAEWTIALALGARLPATDTP